MENILKTRIVVPEDVLMRELAGESVLLNLRSETYFGLDQVGTQMWVSLTTTSNVSEAFDRLLNEYDTDPECLRVDLSGFIEKMCQFGLLNVEAG